MQVVTIQGKPAFDVLRRYGILQPREGRDFDPDIGRNMTFLMYCMANDYGQEKLVLELKNNSGQIESIAVDAVAYKDLFTPGSNSSLSGRRLPITYKYHSDCRTGVMKVNIFEGGPDFSAATKKAFTNLKTQNAENLIIDLRNCPGGNTLFSDELLGYLTDKEYKWNVKGKLKYSKLYQQQRGKLPGHILNSFSSSFTGGNLSLPTRPIKPQDNPLRFKGSLYVLINGRSRSTAGVFAVVVRHYNLGRLIGEQTGETIVSYGDNLSFKLPNSRLTGTVACKQFIMPGATKENASKGVQPHISIRPSLEDLWKGHDPVMKYALEQCGCENGKKLQKTAKKTFLSIIVILVIRY